MKFEKKKDTVGESIEKRSELFNTFAFPNKRSLAVVHPN